MAIETPTAPSARQASPGRLSGRSASIGGILVLPGQLLMLFIVLFPALVAIYIGFTEWSPTSGDSFWSAYKYWHWFSGYWEALSSTEFWGAMLRTVVITVVCTAVELILGFGLALLLLKDFRGRGLVSVYFLLPMMVVPAVTGFIFFMLFQVDGPINALLTAILPGDVAVNWLNGPRIAIWTVMFADIWQWTPLMFLIFLSGLVALPEDQMNAARILGANFRSQMRMLILPMMKPILLIAVIIRAMEVFKLFDPIYIMTEGGPGNATQNISIYMFRQTIINNRWGFAAAVAILVLIFLSIVAMRAIRPIERAQEESLADLLDTTAPGASEGPSVEQAIDAQAVEAAEGETADDFSHIAPGRIDARPERRGFLGPFARVFAILAAAIAFGFPLYWAVTMSFKPKPEQNPPGQVYWKPAHPTLKNYSAILGTKNTEESIFATAKSFSARTPLKNSFIAAIGGTAVAMFVGVFAAYGIARFRGGGAQLPFQILQMRMFPPIAVIIPLLFMFVYLKLWDTIFGLIIIYGAVTFPFVVWLMRSFFQEVPREISEAAIVDGCSQWGAFFKSVLPQVRGGLAATALFVFILNWSDFLIVLVMTQDNWETAPLYLQSLAGGSGGQEYGLQSALAMLLILPPAIFGISIQKYLVRGLTFGAIKR